MTATEIWQAINGGQYDSGYFFVVNGVMETRPVEAGLMMELIAIAIFVIGLMFWLIYTAKTFNTTNAANGKLLPFNSWLKTILYVFAGYLAFFTLQLAYGMAVDNGVGIRVSETLKTNYTLGLSMGVIILLIIFFGYFGNMAMKIVDSARTYFTRRKK